MRNSGEPDLGFRSSPIVLRSRKAIREARLMDPPFDEEPVQATEAEAPDETEPGETENSEEKDEAAPNAQGDSGRAGEPPGIPVAVFRQECERAYERGFEEGKKAGIEIGKAETQSVLRYLDVLSQELVDVRGKLLDQAEEMVVKLACSIARKVIYKEVETDPSLILRAVRRALSYVGEEEKTVIKVNPVDYKHIHEYRQDLLPSGEGNGALEFEPDDRIERGGCVIETGSGTVDGRMSSRFERIERALLEELENG